MKKSNDEPPVLGICIFLYLLPLLICSIMQASTASYDSQHSDVCETTYRFDYIFPARTIGCWLGTKVK